MQANSAIAPKGASFANQNKGGLTYILKVNDTVISKPQPKIDIAIDDKPVKYLPEPGKVTSGTSGNTGVNPAYKYFNEGVDWFNSTWHMPPYPISAWQDQAKFYYIEKKGSITKVKDFGPASYAKYAEGAVFQFTKVTGIPAGKPGEDVVTVEPKKENTVTLGIMNQFWFYIRTYWYISIPLGILLFMAFNKKRRR